MEPEQAVDEHSGADLGDKERVTVLITPSECLNIDSIITTLQY